MKKAVLFAAALALLSAPALAQSSGGGLNKDEPSGMRRGQSNDVLRTKTGQRSAMTAPGRSSKKAKRTSRSRSRSSM